MARTNSALVQEVLDRNYDLKRSPSLKPYIDAASLTVTRLVDDAAVKGFTHTSDELEMIERVLAAYNYCKMDPLWQSKSTQGASGAHVTSQTLDGEQERYKRWAIEIDASGCLNALLNRRRAGGVLLRVEDPYDTQGTQGN